MHHYNDTTFIHRYSSAYYTGPALRVQTGAEGGSAGAHASAEGYTVVAGACPTVKMVPYLLLALPPKSLRFAYQNRPVGISVAAATVILRDGTASRPTRCWNGSW